MKKLLAIVPLFLLLGACATNAPIHTADKKAFTCEDGGKVNASYSTDGDTAYLDVNLPKAGLTSEKLTLTQAVSGSGARYINESNPKVSYEWHTKADFGIMSVNWANGKEYSVSCNL